MNAQPSSDRRAMLAKVHVAKKQVVLDDADYRAVLMRVTGHSSSGDCDDAQLHAVLAEFKRLGWTSVGTGTRRTSGKPHVRKIYAIWGDLRLLIGAGSDDALRAFVARQTRSVKNPSGISAPEFLDAAEANKVTEGLKAWLKREQGKRGETKPS